MTLNFLRRSLRYRELFLLALSDLHAFHACGLTPDGFIGSLESAIHLNRGQRYLLECFEHMLDQLPDRIDGLFLLGDLGEGQNPSEEARYLQEPDPVFQSHGIVQLLRPIVCRVPVIEGQREIYMVRGTRYHTARGATIEEVAGALMGARRKGSYYAPPWRHVMVDGVMFDLAHHQSFTIRYRSMPLEREYAFKAEYAGKTGALLPEYLIILRGHTHTGFKMLVEGKAYSISAPCFKLQDFYAQGSRTPNRMIPENIGAVGIKVYPEPRGGSRVHVLPYLYDHPQDSPEVLRYER